VRSALARRLPLRS